MITHIITQARARVVAVVSLVVAAVLPFSASAHPSQSGAWDEPSCDEDQISHHRITNIEVTQIDGLRRRTMTVRAGPSPIDRFLLHRVSLPVPNHALRGVILLLPPVSSGFQNYEVGEGGDYLSSFVGYFASRGYDVWGYSQRVQGLAAGTCESGAADCSVMATWGMGAIVDDIAFIRRRIASVRPHARVAIGGLSMGGMAAIATLNEHPHAYAGAFLLEGTLYDTDAASRSINQGYCAYFDGLLAQGGFYDGDQLPGVKGLVALASLDPDGPSSFPGVPPGFTNHQTFVSLFSTPKITPTTPRPGYFLLAGDAAADELSYANDALFRANVAEFVDYVPSRLLRDINCSLAGDRTWTNHLGAYRGPLFVNASGHGFGQAMLDTVGLMPHAEARVNFMPTFGHVDHFFAEDHRALTEEPLLAWLEDEVFPTYHH